MFDIGKMVMKGLKGFLIGLIATVVLAIAAALSNYNPVICSATITDNCTPQFMMVAYMSIIPTMVGGLTAFANWLKNKEK